MGAAVPRRRDHDPTSDRCGDPLQLWAKLFPVFSHPRCINCHGVVQSQPGLIRSVTGKTHPGGFVDEPDEQDQAVNCGQCHNTPDILEEAWKLTAPESMWWV